MVVLQSIWLMPLAKASFRVLLHFHLQSEDPNHKSQIVAFLASVKTSS